MTPSALPAKKSVSVKAKKIEHPKYVSYEGLDSVGETALFYGFTPLAQPHIHADDITQSKSISECEIVVDQDNHEEGAVVRLEEKVALLHMYEKEKMGTLAMPLMYFYKKPFIGDRRKPSTKESHYGFEIIGTDKSIAEAILMQTAVAVLHDAGDTDLHVEINSIGDKESLARFTREVTAYYRKNLSSLPAKCRETFKKDVFALLGCDHEDCLKLAADCPKSINFLSERSRQHFKEVLEFLESLEIPYTINNALVANRDFCGETVFEIRGTDPKSHPKAIGIRYNTLAKRLGHKKELPAVGVSIAIPKKAVAGAEIKMSVIAKILDPQICFMQLGFEAKLKSLRLIESFRQARVPVAQSLAKDKIAGQVGQAEKMQAPVVVIMGKKEAMENTVIIRETSTRSQNAVLASEAALALKRFRV